MGGMGKGVGDAGWATVLVGEASSDARMIVAGGGVKLSPPSSPQAAKHAVTSPSRISIEADRQNQPVEPLYCGVSLVICDSCV